MHTYIKSYKHTHTHTKKAQRTVRKPFGILLETKGNASFLVFYVDQTDR